MAAGPLPPPTAPTPSTAPQRKVIAATGGAAVGSAVAVVLTYIMTSSLKKFNIDLPTDVISAFNTIFTTISAFSFGYYTSPGLNEIVVQDQSGNPVTALR